MKKYLDFFYWCGLVLFLFLLPLQTRLIVAPGMVHGTYFEYATISLYATELLAVSIIVLAFLRGYERIAGIFLNSQRKCLGFIMVALFVVLAIAAHSHRLFILYTLAYWLAAAGAGAVAYGAVRERKLLVLGAFWAGGVVQALLAVGQFFSQTIFASKWLGMAEQHAPTLGVSVVENSAGRWLRAYGSFGWPTSLGIYLAIVLVAGVYLAVAMRRPFVRGLVIAGQAVIAAGLFVTFARGAWIAAMVGFAWYGGAAYVEHRRVRNSESKDRLSVVCAMAAAIALVVVMYGSIMHPLVSSRVKATAALERRSVDERVLQYKDARMLLLKQPVFGVGPGVYTHEIARLFPDRAAHDLQVVHNIFILHIVQLGCAAAAVLFIIGLRAAWRFRFHPEFLAPVVVVMVAGLFDHWLASLWSGVAVFALAWGLSLGMKKEP